MSKDLLIAQKTWLLVLAICAVCAGIFLRLYNLDSKICWLDESYTLLRVSGFTVEEVINEAKGGNITKVGDLLKYQKLNKDAGSTIYASAAEDPHMPPLYYLLERAWCSCFGDSISTFRSLSVVGSIMCLPLVWILAMELFASSNTAAVSTVLMALSPIQVIYAQEARPYSLWCVLILSMSIAFIKAMEKGKPWWLLYGVFTGIALWIHPLSIFVLAANALYAAIMSAKNNSWEKLRSFGLSALIALVIFSPWIYVMFSGLDTIRAHVGTQEHLHTDWLFDVSYPFIDLPTTEYFAILAAAIPLMQLFAVGALLYTKQWKPFLFLACLGLIPTFSLLAPEFFLGGMRSFIPRYLFPLYLSLVLCIAFLISALVSSNKRWKQLTGSFLLLIFIFIAIRSDWLMLQERTWWNKAHSNYLIPIAERINQAEHPYLFSQASTGTMLVLSHLLRPEIPLTLLSAQKIDRLPENASDIFLLSPTPELLIELKARGVSNLTSEDKDGRLWVIRPNK